MVTARDGTARDGWWLHRSPAWSDRNCCAKGSDCTFAHSVEAGERWGKRGNGGKIQEMRGVVEVLLRPELGLSSSGTVVHGPKRAVVLCGNEDSPAQA